MAINRQKKPQFDCPNKYVIDRNGQPVDVQNAREEREWREWVDNRFIHVISPNVYRTLRESLRTFNWFSKFGDWEHNFPFFERHLAIYVGAFMMYIIAKRLKKRHHIVDARQSLFDACDEWMNAIGRDRQFLGGQSPNLADLAMYGAMTAFTGCDAFDELRAHKPEMAAWFDQMRALVEMHAGADELAQRLDARQRSMR